MPRIALNGIELHFERQGDGPPLLALAGMASDSASWQPLVAGLAAGFDLIRPDNRCTGQTRPIPCPTGREAMLADCLALMDALRIGRAHLVGHSMGGMLALHLAARHPDRVASVVVMASTGQAGPLARAVFAALAALRSREVDRPELFFRLLFPWLFGPGFFADPAAVDEAVAAALAYPHRQPPAAFLRQVAMLEEFAAPPDPGAIRAPVLALAAREDPLAPPRTVRAAFAGRPGFAVSVIPGAGHALHWEQPDAVLAAIRDFHARLSGK